MQRLKHKKFTLLTTVILTPLTITISKVNASTFGAEIFCAMRDAGNNHESSWEAAYTYIKQKKGGIFKVSPKRAASQITETVIRESEKFSYCVEYLDKLYPNRKIERKLDVNEEFTVELDDANEEFTEELGDENEEFTEELDDKNEEFTEDILERYSY